MRKKIVAGNWKMNLTPNESNDLIKNIKNLSNEVDKNVDLIVFPPFVYIENVVKLLADTNVSVGAQNCCNFETGAYTGEVSAKMISSIGAKYVIIGHSERRQYFEESDQILLDKTKMALKENLTPIFCIGETLGERNEDIHFEIIKSQLDDSIFRLEKKDLLKVVIAYEPVWAIGTGLTASKEQAQEMHKFIRDEIYNKIGKEIANEISILYGGSCKPENATELFACPDVDGGLIGGASLKAESFIKIVQGFKK